MCKDKRHQAHDVIIKQPMGFLELGVTCVATSDHMTLIASYNEKILRSNVSVTTPIDRLVNYQNLSSIRLWKPFHQTLPHVTEITLPSRLKEVRPVPMNKFLSQLQTWDNLEPDANDDWFLNNVLPTFGMTVIIICVLVICIKCKPWSAILSMYRSKATTDPEGAKVQASRDMEGDLNAVGSVHPKPGTKNEDSLNIVHRLYPSVKPADIDV